MPLFGFTFSMIIFFGIIRFCGISNSFVKCNVEGSSTSIAAPQPKSEAIAGSSRHTFTSAVSAPQQNKVQQYSPKVGPQSLNVVKDVKNETNSKADNEQSTKASMDKEKVIPMPTNKKKSQNDNNSSETGSSLANLWGRAAVKSKPNSAPAYDNKSITDPTGLFHYELSTLLARMKQFQYCRCSYIYFPQNKLLLKTFY